MSKVEGWRDMKDAPRDGTNILLSPEEFYGDIPVVGWWDEDEARWLILRLDHEDSDYFADEILEGWMPIPTAKWRIDQSDE